MLLIIYDLVNSLRLYLFDIQRSHIPNLSFKKHLATFDDIPQILNEPLFDKAFKTVALAAMSPKERKEYEQIWLDYSGMKAAMDTSEEKGKEKGIEIGIKQGIPQGELIKARKIPKK